MGFLSALALSAGKGLVGSFFGRKSASKAREQARQDFVLGPSRVREGADLANFNPLTVLEGGGGLRGAALTSSAIPALASADLARGVIQDVDDKMQAEKKRKDNEKKAAEKHKKIQKERNARGGSSEVFRATSLTNASTKPINSRINLNGASIGPNVTQAGGATSLPFVVREDDRDFTKDTELKMPTNITNEHVGPVRQSFTLPDGGIVSIPVGPDIDEVISGSVLQSQPFIDKAARVGRALAPLWHTPFPAMPSEAERKKRRKEKEKRGKEFTKGIPDFMKE